MAAADEGAQDPQTEAFPWPPVEEENVIFAAGETWRSSLFEPSRFYRAMPSHGYLSALAYYLPLSIIGAALELFWRSSFDALGFSWPLDRLWRAAPAANPALDRLLGFLISPLTALAALLLIAATLHATLKLLGAARRPFVATTRVLAFAAGTQLFLIVPVLGTLLALVWSAVLTVVGLREVQQTSTARALVALLIPTVLLGIAVTLMMALVRALGISAL